MVALGAREVAGLTPTLAGRIQTRLFLVVVIGIPWTIIAAPPIAAASGVSVGDMYAVGFAALLWVGVIGIGWELVYHALQQLRWEKDWPTFFGLVTGLPEGLLILLLLAAGAPADLGPIPVFPYIALFGTTWVLIWLVANGPMRLVFIRWRYRGGRLV